MKHLWALAALALASMASAKDRPAQGGQGYANPSDVIATETAFARNALELGQWTAMSAYATPDAVLFTPQMAYAAGWLKGRPNPAAPRRWQPHVVWSSCDGSLVISHGAWQQATKTGFYTTIWQRQKGGGQKDGTYKWLLTHSDDLKAPLQAPEMISGLVADCPERGKGAKGPPPPKKGKEAKKPTALPPLDPAKRSGQSDDGTLTWTVTVEPDGARNLSAEWKKDGAVSPMLIEAVDAPLKQ